jgi:hypothetical protein
LDATVVARVSAGRYGQAEIDAARRWTSGAHGSILEAMAERIFRTVVLVWAGGLLLYCLVGAVYGLSFLWPWFDVQLRASPALSDLYERCSRIRVGSTVEDVTRSMHGLQTRNDMADVRSMWFYTPQHSGDMCRVQLSRAEPRRVTEVEFLPD